MSDVPEGVRAALQIEDDTERLLEIAAVVSEALTGLARPVVVGGLAVAYWTAGVYQTGDIDIVMPWSPEVDERLASLGFEKEGRFWRLPGADVFLEAPGSALQPGEEVEVVEVKSGRTLAVLRPEDVLVYRLHEFVATGHSDPLGQAMMLVDSPDLDRERLGKLTGREGLTEALREVEQLARRVERGEKLETWQLHDIARRLQ